MCVLSSLQDRFHDFVPALSKWSGTVVGMTLIAIGLMGVYETYFESASAEGEEEQELKLAVAGKRSSHWAVGSQHW